MTDRIPTDDTTDVDDEAREVGDDVADAADDAEDGVRDLGDKVSDAVEDLIPGDSDRDGH